MAVVAAVGHGAGRDLQGCEQCRGPVALVVVGGLLRQAGPDREDRLGAVERLDLGLLVHAQHDRVARRVQVQTDDIADLGLKLGVGGELERALPPGLHPVGAPRPRDRRVTDPELLGQQSRGPVRDRQLRGRRLQRRGDDLRVVDRLGSAAARPIPEARDPVGGKPLAPLDHRRT